MANPAVSNGAVTAGSGSAASVKSAESPLKTEIRVPPPKPPAPSAFGADFTLLACTLAMFALNLTVLVLFKRMLSGRPLGGALVEKDPAVIQDATAALIASHKASADAAAAVSSSAAVAGNAPPAPTLPTPLTPEDVVDALPASYSRVAGAFGAIVLAAALYGLANYLVWAAFYQPDKISNVLEETGTFFLAGSALFAPYAVNQLTSIFPRPPAPK